MAQENPKVTFDRFQNDTDILELKNKIKNTQDTYVKTRKRCTHEEEKLKKVEEEHKHIQKQLYICQLMNELDSLEDDIKKEQNMYDSTHAKRKQMENETERLNKSKLRTFYFRHTY